MILAIETSSKVCGISLHDDTGCVAERYLEEERVHAEKLVTLTAEILEENSIRIPALETVVVSAGPGSFTGLRIGMSFAKGLVYPHRIPLAAVNSMHAYIAGCRDLIDPDEHPLWLLRSHRDYVYSAGYASEFPQLDIHYCKTGDIASRYPQCRHIISNTALSDLGPEFRITRRSLLPSLIGNYYQAYFPGSAGTDYDSLVLEYGMAYKPKEWENGTLR
ncbi:MAG: tRNA (adenosine(37)-N6)-threonylcarbamoyltransferase complex dimerization subunit type 1 TsaB [Candidatus Neomarinimicrobiota bacterium]|jgi:tRNA threonylcarbamoyl adenosine modification protein YeaZ|nr:tRNA (adenosine(37)-N6)-threonylcarbamoyltransferase complex dimerization subunit type 1 TsaB [Candidatus Neomarinimicrobiota bacterium]MDD3965723.1 tRNA (adenosine(37)-N6)-threonylcarbamoyltransferase complex dimerization subunit type 1 TsaB [Candidatus Neomarinimicrobiota bacterium]MDX9779581.1 tRNA (adenosine(37)-N6)-threonylcarbamoyltransferase complex dimerization subunit type 1 TsaB [bacterium]